MNLLELAQKRCSIRKYASSPVEDEKLASTKIFSKVERL